MKNSSSSSIVVVIFYYYCFMNSLNTNTYERGNPSVIEEQQLPLCY
jgi:hypothetical protein